MGHGGTRRGAGRRPGKARLDKEAARELVRELVTRELSSLVEAQIANAKGLKYLVTRDKASGKFIRVGPALAAASGEETIEVWEKDPQVQAFTDLLNRAIDKPKEQQIEVKVSGELELVARLVAGRKRLAGASDARG